MCNIRGESIGSLVWGSQRQLAMLHAVEYHNGILHADDTGPTWCTIMVKDGTCGAFNLLNATFRRVLILFVGFIFLATYPISVNNILHSPHKIFLCIIIPDVYWGSTLAELVLKYLGDVNAWLGSYSIEISEKCLRANNNFNSGGVIVCTYRR